MEIDNNQARNVRPIFILLVGFALTVSMGIPIWNELNSLFWPKVDGQILNSRLDLHRATPSSSSTLHALVLYSYIVDGRHYTGDTVTMRMVMAFPRPISLVNRFQKGSPVSVAVNPRNPYQSVLIPGFSIIDLALFIFGLFVLKCGAQLIFKKRIRTDVKNIPVQ